MEKVEKNLELEAVKMDEKGFTLIELIVVMAIIAILVLLAAPRFLGYTKDANATALRQDAKVVSDAVMMYNIDNEDTWPTADGKLSGETAIAADSLDNYIKSTTHDYTEFVIVDKEGKVKHNDGVKDKNDNTVWNNFKDDDTPAE